MSDYDWLTERTRRGANVIQLRRSRKFWIGASLLVALASSLLYLGSAQTSARAGVSAQPPSFDATGSAESTISAAPSMSALVATPAEAAPSSLANAVSALNASPGSSATGAAAVGSVDASHMHLLLSNVGTLGDSVYAATTDTGEVCILDLQGPAGCFSQFTSAIPVIWQGAMTPAGAWTHITGLAPDRVASIALAEAGGNQPALLQNDAFYVEPTSQPTALLLTYKDGTTQTVPLPTQAPPTRSP